MSTLSGRHALPYAIITLAWLCVVTAYPKVLHASWDTVIFYDDFEQPDYTLPDQNKWIINHPDALPPLNPDWWVQGRSHFPNPSPPSPAFTPPELLPYVKENACVIPQRLYNPLDSGHWTFVGGEISTRTHYSFPPDKDYLFEARVKCNVSPNGLVSSFFLYGYDRSNSDEIDFEFLSNETNKYDPNQDAVHLTAWNESQHKWAQKWPPGLDLTKWQVFRIYWYPQQHRIDWTWLDPANGEVPLLTETDPFYVADQPMDLYFNFWAATDAWPKAYDASFQPMSDPNLDQVYTYEIDYVVVRVPEPATWASMLIGAICGVIWLVRKGKRGTFNFSSCGKQEGLRCRSS